MMKTAAVLTISDSSFRGERPDISGPTIAALLGESDFDVTRQELVPDERQAIEAALLRLSTQVQLIVTTGGTGLAERDVTPEATHAVCSRLLDGIPEKMRAAGLEETPYAVLSRGICGVCGGCLILNLPGSPHAAAQSLEAVIEVLPHALDLLAGKTAHALHHQKPAP